MTVGYALLGACVRRLVPIRLDPWLAYCSTVRNKFITAQYDVCVYYENDRRSGEASVHSRSRVFGLRYVYGFTRAAKHGPRYRPSGCGVIDIYIVGQPRHYISLEQEQQNQKGNSYYYNILVCVPSGAQLKVLAITLAQHVSRCRLRYAELVFLVFSNSLQRDLNSSNI